MSKDIYVTGHPRSGNTWLCRLLSYILLANLDSNTAGGDDYQYWGEGDPKNDYIIHKTHSLEKLPGPTVFIYRDPRDVVCSRWHYQTKHKTLRHAIETLTLPEHNPNDDHYGKYETFIRTWWNTGLADAQVRYEDLHIDPQTALQRVVYGLTGNRVSSQHILNGVFWLEFSTFKARNAPYMDHSMWTGKVGNWREYFTKNEADLCQYYWGDLMREQGYIAGPEWVYEVRQK